MVALQGGQFWRSGRGAIARCHCSVLWLGGEGDDQLWGSGRGAIGGVDVVPLQGAIAVCFGWGGG